MRKNKNGAKLLLLNLVSFLLGFQAALIAYVTSSFLEESSGTKNVGIFYFLAYGGALLVMLNCHHLVKKHGKSKVFIIFLFFKVLVLAGTGIFAKTHFAPIFIVWALMSGQLMWLGLDILIESFSKDSITGTIRGRILTIENFGWVIAPFLSAWVVENLGYGWVYSMGTVLVLGALAVILWKFPDVNHNIKKDLGIKAVIKKILRRKNIARIYYVALMLEIFYATTVVYTPLYLVELGYSWLEIGKIFTVMLLPFILLQYPLGVLADKKTGEKEWLMFAFVLISLTTVAISFINQASLLIWMAVLFSTRIGAAIIEVMRDSYFYKQIKAQDVDLIDFYRTTRSVAYIFSALFFSFFLAFFSLKLVFVVLACIVATGLVPLGKITDTK